MTASTQTAERAGKRRMVARMRKGLLSPVFIVMLLAAMMLAMPVKAAPDPGLVGLWHFDTVDTTGSPYTTPDSSGQDNIGYLYPVGSEPTLTDGKFGKALSFDGVDDYVSVPASDGLNIAGAITVEAWVMVDSFETGTRFYTVAGKWNDQGVNCRAYLLGIQQYQPRFYVSSTGEDFDLAISSQTLDTGFWYHLVGTFDGDVLRIYVNGMERGSKDTTLTSIVLNDQPLLIASDRAGGHEGRFFDGIIDEVRIYNRALTSDEILYRYRLRQYNVGWLPPVSFKTVYRDGQTVPIRFTVSDADGFITDTSVTVTVTGNGLSLEFLYDPSATDHSHYVRIYDNSYIVNWHDMPSGTYTITVSFSQTPMLSTTINVV